MLVDLEGGSEMLGDWMIYSSAWGSPSRGSVDLPYPKLGHDLPERLLSFPLYLSLSLIGNISVVHPSQPLGPPPDGAAETGFALSALPSLPAAGLPQPLLQAGRNSSNPGQFPEFVHAALPRQCQYNRNQQAGWLVLPGKCML